VEAKFLEQSVVCGQLFVVSTKFTGRQGQRTIDNTMNIRKLLFTLLLTQVISVAVPAQGTRLLRHPTVSRDSVAFEYAGDLWVVSRSGGPARRLTSTPGAEIDPYFSPDGSQIAYTSTVAGNTDVYVVPAAGGDPKRLTYHPGIDRVRGWTPDGRRVIFASVR